MKTLLPVLLALLFAPGCRSNLHPRKPSESVQTFLREASVLHASIAQGPRLPHFSDHLALTQGAFDNAAFAPENAAARERFRGALAAWQTSLHLWQMHPEKNNLYPKDEDDSDLLNAALSTSGRAKEQRPWHRMTIRDRETALKAMGLHPYTDIDKIDRIPRTEVQMMAMRHGVKEFAAGRSLMP